MKTRQGTLKTAIFVLGCVTFSLLEASTFRCYYPDGCDVARIWVFAAFLYCWVGSSLLLLLRLSWLSSGISRFDTIEFTWSAFCCVNYLIASLVLSAYLKCIGFAHFDCRCRLMSNLFGYLVACLHGFDVYLYVKSKEDSDNVINSTEENWTTKAAQNSSRNNLLEWCFGLLLILTPRQKKNFFMLFSKSKLKVPCL